MSSVSQTSHRTMGEETSLPATRENAIGTEHSATASCPSMPDGKVNPATRPHILSRCSASSSVSSSASSNSNSDSIASSSSSLGTNTTTAKTTNSTTNHTSSSSETSTPATTTPARPVYTAHPKYACHTPQLCPKTGQKIHALDRQYAKPTGEINIEEALARGPLPGRFYTERAAIEEKEEVRREEFERVKRELRGWKG